jgi:hypothetical protein
MKKASFATVFMIVGLCAVAACFWANGVAVKPAADDGMAPRAQREGRMIDGHSLVWGENVGWVDLGSRRGDLRIGSNVLAGWVWFENVGWVCVGSGKPLDGKRYSNRLMDDWGVNNDGAGNLYGYAWSETAGWINFKTDRSRVTLDANGCFYGYAWGENVGWIHFGAGGDARYLAKATPRPWREIGTESERRFSGNGGGGESYMRGDNVPPSGLKRGSERYDEHAGILCMGMVAGDGYYGYVRHDERPVCIEFGRESDYIRGPPVI